MLKLKLQYLEFCTWCEELTHWKRPWCRERLKAGGEGDNRGWDGWMASPTRWTWVWASSRSWWRSWKPGVLQSMGLKRVRQDRATELNWYPNFCFLRSFRLKFNLIFNSLSLVRKTMVVTVYTTLYMRYTYGWSHKDQSPAVTIFQCLKRIVSYVLPSFILIYSRKAGPFIPVTLSWLE